MLVVCCGFTVAFVMINRSVSDWRESPVSTSTETVAISEVSFPPIIVCPPKVTTWEKRHFLISILQGNLHKFER